MNQQRLLLITIGVLLPIWWVTRPSVAPVQPAPKNVWASPPAPKLKDSSDRQGPELGANERAIDTDSGPRLAIRRSAPEPEWLAVIDTSRPECREMKEELLRRLSDGTLTDLIYLGDCDTRREDKQ